jgi:hypothetical protein
MKRISTLMIASIALVAASCSSTEDATEEVAVEAVTYSLDADASSLGWAANMGPEYGHKGTVNVTEGSISMEGESLTSGSFTIDMSTIKSTDLEEPKAGYLAAHLQGTAPDEDHPADLFFNVPQYPTVGVTLNSYEGGKLNLTLNMLGKELTQDAEVELSSDENGATIKGDFTLDFTSLEIPGLQPNPEDDSQINPVIEFSLDIVLKK